MRTYSTRTCLLCRAGFVPKFPRQPYCSTRCNLFAHVDVAGPDECWLWTAYINPTGYGQITTGGKPQLAHRVSWIVAKGPISDDLNVLHRCDVRPCVNPVHLFLGTHADNSADMVAKDRTNPVIGERVWSAKLKEADVLKILSSPLATPHHLAAQFGVAPATIMNIRAGRRWKHLQNQGATQ